MRWRWSPPDRAAAGIARLLLAEPGTAAGAVRRTFPLAEFQEEAVRRARAIMGRRGGVIVADEVGLGKTYVGVALIEEALREGERVALVVPASVRPAWTRLIRRLRTGPGGDLYVTSHTRLSRGTHDADRLSGATLVVVDEAHAFRNPGTRRYRALAARRPGSRLLLLSATPVNNSVKDLYHLIRQFAADDGFLDVGVASLRGAFIEPDRSDGLEGAARVAPEVVVRRTRAEVREPSGRRGRSRPHGRAATARDEAPAAAAPALRFPRRAATRVIGYDDPRVPELVAGIAGLELVPYALPARGPRPAGHPAAAGGTEALLRLGLLKRLESGGAALGGSLRRLRAFLLLVIDAAERGFVLTPADRPGAAAAGDRDSVQLLLQEVALAPAHPGVDLGALAASARRDADAIARMLRRLRQGDPKLDALVAWAAARPRGQKAVIFTEFRDTAAALWRALLPLGGVGRVDGGGAWLGARRGGRRAVVERFAPVSSGCAEPPARERVDLLVATDVLSEGLNLQDACVVVSYDLPWNPVRLLQRVGRIDRLGSVHDFIRPILFVPDSGLDDVLRLTRTLTSKLGGIAATVEAEDAGELLARLGGDRRADPVNALRGELGASPWERLRAALREIGSTGTPPRPGAAPDVATPLLGAAATVHDPRAGAAWLVLARAGDARPRLLLVRPRGSVRDAGADGAEALRALLSDHSKPPASALRIALEREAAIATARAVRYLGSAQASAPAPPKVGARDPAARAGRAVRRALAESGPEPEPGLLRRADAALAALARPLDLPTRARIERLRVLSRARSAGARDSTLEALLEALEGALGALPERDGDGPCGKRPAGVIPTSLAALRIPCPAPSADPPPAVDGRGRRD